MSELSAATIFGGDFSGKASEYLDSAFVLFPSVSMAILKTEWGSRKFRAFQNFKFYLMEETIQFK